MTLDEFVKAFAAEFDDTPEDQFAANTEFKTLEEWGSLTALSIISMVDESMDKTITGRVLIFVRAKLLRICTTLQAANN